MVERCEPGGEDGTDVVQRRSGVEVGTVGETLNMIAGCVRIDFGPPEESFWVRYPIFGVQTIARRTRVQRERTDFGRPGKTMKHTH